jgi:hypothetical protein
MADEPPRSPIHLLPIARDDAHQLPNWGARLLVPGLGLIRVSKFIRESI